MISLRERQETERRILKINVYNITTVNSVSNHFNRLTLTIHNALLYGKTIIYIIEHFLSPKKCIFFTICPPFLLSRSPEVWKALTISVICFKILVVKIWRLVWQSYEQSGFVWMKHRFLRFSNLLNMGVTQRRERGRRLGVGKLLKEFSECQHKHVLLHVFLSICESVRRKGCTLLVFFSTMISCVAVWYAAISTEKCSHVKCSKSAFYRLDLLFLVFVLLRCLLITPSTAIHSVTQII